MKLYLEIIGDVDRTEIENLSPFQVRKLLLVKDLVHNNSCLVLDLESVSF